MRLRFTIVFSAWRTFSILATRILDYNFVSYDIWEESVMVFGISNLLLEVVYCIHSVYIGLKLGFFKYFYHHWYHCDICSSMNRMIILKHPIFLSLSFFSLQKKKKIFKNSTFRHEEFHFSNDNARRISLIGGSNIWLWLEYVSPLSPPNRRNHLTMFKEKSRKSGSKTLPTHSSTLSSFH